MLRVFLLSALLALPSSVEARQSLASDSLALVALYNATNGPAWTTQTGWLTDPVSTWSGVTVGGGRVVEIDLWGNGLSGTLPDEIGQLSELVSLQLGANAISGAIPSTIASLTSLQTLNLPRNGLTGPMPDELGQLVSLRSLDLSNNPLGGGIISQIGNLSELTFLWLCSTELEGSIPAELWTLSKLYYLSLCDNELDGSVSSDISLLVDLVYVDFSRNGLSGPIPVEIGTLSNLTYLDLGWNDFAGEVPAFLTSMTGLQDLSLSGAGFSGLIPAGFGALPQLTGLYLDNNSFSGSIPSDLGNSATLVGLYLGGNELTGTIPPELGQITSLEWLDVGFNMLTGTIPDELGALTSLEFLSVHANQLTGGLPSSLAHTPLRLLSLFENDLDELPDLSAADSLKVLNLWGNRFTFADLEPLVTLPGLESLDYGSQDPIGSAQTVTLKAGDRFFARMSVDGSANAYQWDLYGSPLDGATTDSLTIDPLTANDAGFYTLRITNSLLPDLELASAPIELRVERAPTVATDSLALVALYNETSGPDWTSATDWLTGPVWEWEGVDTDYDSGRVTHLYLSSRNISGPLPASFSDLTALVELNMGDNKISGSLPESIGNATQLRYMSFCSNELTGAIPESIWSLSALESLYLCQNQLEGTLSASVADMASLRTLSLGDNRLSGELPAEIGQLPALVDLNIGSNEFAGSLPAGLGAVTTLESIWACGAGFSGRIPPELGALSELKTLGLCSNSFHGLIPPELGGLSKVDYFDLSYNSLTGSLPAGLEGLISVQTLSFQANQLSGEVPVELASLPSLQYLILRDNDLVGEIPAELFSMASLGELDLANNALTGPIPAAVGNAPALQRLDLQGNLLSGSIPSEIGQLTTLTSLDLSDNGLTGAVPPAIGTLVNLQYLSVEYNNLTSLPDLSGLTALEALALTDNRFTFEDLEPLVSLGLPNLYIYSQQAVSADTSLTVRAGDRLALGFPVGGTANVYQWTRWGSDMTGATSDSLIIDPVSRNDDGSYRLIVTNSLVPDVELTSGYVEVTVAASGAAAADSLALVALYTSTGGGGWTSSENWLSGPMSDWYGVYVDFDSGRVRELVLYSNGLSGPLPAELGQLAELETLLLSGNGLAGAIPASFSDLVSLRSLSLSDNQLDGPIPVDLGTIVSLTHLDLGYNRFTGSVPVELASLTALEVLELCENELSGSIPNELGTMASLRVLSLCENALVGSLPLSLGNLLALESLQLSGNNLSGPLPAEWGALANLTHLNLYGNSISGPIPPEFGQMARLGALWLCSNSLSGPIPGELGRLSQLNILALCNNDLSGPMPPELGSLSSLRHFYLSGNQFSGDLPETIGTLSHLVSLEFGRNQLEGNLPESLSGHPSLQYIHGWDNQLTGPVPEWVFDLPALTDLDLSSNQLSGSIPVSIGNASALRYLDLSNNLIDGAIPPEIGGATNLDFLRLGSNRLDGTLPEELGTLGQLRVLQVSGNASSFQIPDERGTLGGPIPDALSGLSALESLQLGGNEFLGDIPVWIADLDSLRFVDLGDNKFSGSLPDLSDLSVMEYLTVWKNQLSGPVPSWIGQLSQLQSLDLGRNNFSGAVPSTFSGLDSLRYLGLAQNRIDHLPDLTAELDLEYLYVNENRLRFEHVIPWIGAVSEGFEYGQQAALSDATIRTIPVGGTRTFSVPVSEPGGSPNEYVWLLWGSEVATTPDLTLTDAGPSDEGRYQLQVRNPAAPELILLSGFIDVSLAGTIGTGSGFVSSTVAGTLAAPSGVASDSLGVRYVVDVSTVARSTGTQFETVASGLINPVDVLVTADGALLISDRGDDAYPGGVYRVPAAELGPILSVDRSCEDGCQRVAEVIGAGDMGISPEGVLYLSAAVGSGGLVVRMDVMTGAVTTVAEFRNEQPGGFDWDESGDLLVTLPGSGRVVLIPASGESVVDGTSLLPYFAGLDSPTDLAIGRDGRVYVSTPTAVVFGRTDAAVLTPFVTGLGGAQGNHVSFDNEGRLLITDTAAGSLLIVEAPKQQVQQFPLSFEIAGAGLPALGFEATRSEIQAALNAWQLESTANVTFSISAQPSTAIQAANDGLNVVTFSDTAFPLPAGVLAVASKMLKTDADTGETRIVDADIVFNPTFLTANNQYRLQFGVGDADGIVDIRSTAVHEAGHVLGLVHSGVLDATMFFALQPGIGARDLTADDRAWIGFRYPSDEFGALGSITGRILDGASPDDIGVPAVLVIATNENEDVAVHAYTEADGRFRIPGLPAGNYTVLVDPIDGSTRLGMRPSNVSRYLGSIAGQPAFPSEYYNAATPGNPNLESGSDDPASFDLVSLSAGEARAGIVIITNPDVEPPRVVSIVPTGTAISTRAEVVVTFSEEVQRTGSEWLSLVKLDDNGAAVSTVAGQTAFDSEEQTVLFRPDAPLAADTQFNVTVSLDITDTEGNQLESQGRTHTFRTAPPDNGPPAIVSFLPAREAEGVFTTAEITLVYNEPMDPQTLVHPNLNLAIESAPDVWTDVSFDAEADRDLDYASVVLKPTRPLREGSTYRISLSDNVADATGTAAIPWQSTFATIPAAVPAVLDVGPSDGSVNVQRTSPIVVRFSEPVDRTSAASIVVLSGSGSRIAGTTEFLDDDARVVFRPTEPLAGYDDISVQVTGVRDLDGDLMTEDVRFAFRTALDPNVVSAPPIITSVSPASAPWGAPVSIGGSDFDPDSSLVSVSFQAASGVRLRADVKEATLNRLLVTVPEGAVSGELIVSIRRTGGVDTPSLPFNFVVYAPPSSTDEVVARASIDASARDAEVTPDGALLLATNPSANSVSVVRLDGARPVVEAAISDPGFDTPLHIAIGPSGQRAYVTNFGGHTVSVIDLGTRTVIETIPVGLNPIGITVSPDGSRVYVAEFTAKSVSVIDTQERSGAENQVIARLSTDAGNREVESSPDGTRIYVTGTSGLTVFEFAPGVPLEDAAVRRLARDSSTRDVNASPDGALVFFTTMDGQLVAVDVNPAAESPYQVVARRSREASAREVESSPDGTKLFASTFNSGTVDVYRLKAEQRGGGGNPDGSSGLGLTFEKQDAETITVTGNPEALAFNPLTNTLVATDPTTSDVSVVTFEPTSGVGVVEPSLPATTSLRGNYPNPFNPVTVIAYSLAEPGAVRLEVVDLLGRRIATLVDAERPAGNHAVSFNASDLASGVYLYRLATDHTVLTRSMILLR